MHLATRKYHATCKASSISWVHKADIPYGPHLIGLPASMDPDMAGEFELDVRPVLNLNDEDETEPQAVLLVTARVIKDHQQGARPWLTELELHRAVKASATRTA
jgi:hypothetical protein